MRERDRYDDATQWEAPGQIHRSYRRDRRKRRWQKKQRPKISVRSVMTIACAVVIVVALVQLVSWGSGVIATWRTNRQLQAMRNEAARAAAQVTQAPIMTPYVDASVTATAQPTAYNASAQRTPVVLVTPTTAPQDKIFHVTAGDMLPEFKSLYQKNSDLVGWVTIPGVVDLPVVYRNNTYYLDKDFNKNSSKSGTLFLDEHHPLKSTTQHLVIHGHNMNDGSMFGLLAHYKSKSYIREHGVVTLKTLYQEETYAIFAVAVTPENTKAEGFIPYIGMDSFDTEKSFNYLIDKVKAGALYELYLDVQPTDALLTLSTCIDDDRLLIVCRRLREGESVEEVKRIQRYSID